jgi:hypothetical protein
MMSEQDTRELSPADEAALKRCFDYHAPGLLDRERYGALTRVMREAAREIYLSCPPGPDREAALVALRSARMWSNAAIACGQRGE